MQYFDHGTTVVEDLQVGLGIVVLIGKERLQINQKRLPHALRCFMPNVPVQEKMFQDFWLLDFQTTIAATPV